MEPMTGYELLREVRADDRLSRTPFIMVTAESKTENVIAAKKAGVNNYIVKPFNAATLKAKIDAVFGELAHVQSGSLHVAAREITADDARRRSTWSSAGASANPCGRDRRACPRPCASSPLSAATAEEAAGRILACAEGLLAFAERTACETSEDAVMTIMTACGFHDLVGQPSPR